MKRLFCFALVLLVLFTCCSCSTAVRSGSEVTLVFTCYESDISVVLPEEEAEKVITILDGKNYKSLLEGVRSCGFDSEVCFKINNRTYAIARDTCNCVQDLGNLHYFSISKADMDYIHSLFEKYGGYFPCI